MAETTKKGREIVPFFMSIFLLENFSVYFGMDIKFCAKTTYESSNGGYIVRIDLRNTKHLAEIGQLILKGEAKSLNQYANDMLYYWSKQKLSE